MEKRSLGEWVMDPTGVPGRVSSAVVALVVAIVMVIKGVYAAAVVMLVVALLAGFSAVHYGRRHSGDPSRERGRRGP